MPVTPVRTAPLRLDPTLLTSEAPPSDPTDNVPMGPRTTPLPGSGAAPAPYGTKGFQANGTLRNLQIGAVPPIARGAPKSDAVQVVQTALYALGFIANTGGVDGLFGPKTEAALRAFQAQAPIPETGLIDPATVTALDQAAAAQIQRLKDAQLPQGSKHVKFNIVADISNGAETRIYVLGQDGLPVARYLTSPGTRQYPTRGERFTIRRVLPRRSWVPPQSAWAANARTIGPGISNPMGILKLDFGAYSEYFHGIPFGEEAELGRAASHGCCRMSGANILEFHERYCEAGSAVKINRSAQRSAELRAAFADTGLVDRPIDAGREYMHGYCYGDLGTYQQL